MATSCAVRLKLSLTRSSTQQIPGLNKQLLMEATSEAPCSVTVSKALIKIENRVPKMSLSFSNVHSKSFIAVP